MRYIMRAIKSREHFVDEVKAEIPELEVHYDDTGSAMESLKYTLEHIIGDDACVLFEDDIELCDDFKNKIESVINELPDTLISFFSLSKKNVVPYWKRGKEFCMMQCVYLPKGFASKLLSTYDDWRATQGVSNLQATDFWIGYAWKIEYFVYCPSLVQHRVCVSAIDKRRSSKRQSITFKK